MQRALTQADRRPAGVSILAGRDRHLLERLRPMTARHLVEPIVLAEGECALSNFRSALEDAGPDLRPGTILFLTLIEIGFDWEEELNANFPAYPRGLRIFGLSTGRQARSNPSPPKPNLCGPDGPPHNTNPLIT